MYYFSFSEEEKAKKDPKYYLNRANKDTLGILSELEKTYKEPVSYDCIFFLGLNITKMLLRLLKGGGRLLEVPTVRL